MKVSIIIPVYNAEKYLDTCIGSVLAQTHKDLEVIIIENGSSDGSLAICEKYASSDERVQVVHMDVNIGTGAARNKGLELASGSYICFLDADDWVEPTLVEKYIRAAEPISADVVLCGYIGFRGDDEEHHNFGSHTFTTADEVHKYVATWFPDGRVGFIGNKFYKASLVKKLSFLELSRLEDGFFNLDVFTCAKSCVVIPDELYHYRLSPASVVIAKHNQEYADLVITLTDATFDARAVWGVDAPKDEVYKFCLNELGTSIENTFVGDWGMGYLSRKAYLTQLTMIDTYEDALEHLDLIGSYRRLLHKLLNSEHFILLELLVRLKTFGKGKLTWLYYRLKK